MAGSLKIPVINNNYPGSNEICSFEKWPIFIPYSDFLTALQNRK